MAIMLGSYTRMLLFQRHKRCGVKCNSIKTIKLRKPLFHITRLHSHEPSVTVEMADEPDTDTSEQLPPPESVLEEDAPNKQHAKASGRATRRRLQQEAGRKLFYPSERSLSYLDGSLPGDYGWDPLGLADPRGRPADEPLMNLNWLSYAELIHGRWAMLGAAGALAPELLAKAGATPAATGLPWFVAGGLYTADGASVAIPFFGGLPFHYWTDQYTLLFTMLIAMGFAETRRLQDYRNPGSMGQQYFIGLERILSGSGTPAYPGGQFFNLFEDNAKHVPLPAAGLARNDESEMFRLKTAEIKHGRLAMVAFLALMVQAQSTHLGPVQNLLDHISNPVVNNALVRVGNFITHTSNAERFGYVLWLAAGFAAGALYKSTRDHERDAEAAAN